MSTHGVHGAVHRFLEESPDPVTGSVGGAIGGAALGTAAAVSSLHAGGITLGWLAASVKLAGVGITASVIGSAAAPFVVTGALCCGGVGLVHGLKNWARNDFKIGMK